MYTYQALYYDSTVTRIYSAKLGSISYVYGTWGATFDTGVNVYYIGPSTEFCAPTANGGGCESQYSPLVWPLVWVLILSDVISILALTVFGIMQYQRLRKLVQQLNSANPNRQFGH